MLGLIHRCVLGKGPPQFAQFFVQENAGPVYRCTRAQLRRHSRTLVDLLRGKFLEIDRRSALGLIGVYNMLPSNIVGLNSVCTFQGALQKLVIQQALQENPHWHTR